MAKISEFVGLGTPGPVADMLGWEKASAVGAGSAQTDATVLTSPYTRFTTVNSGEGARLPPAAGRGSFLVVNAGSNALLVYPSSGEAINGGTADASFSVTNAKRAVFFPVGNDWVAILSA